MRPTEHPKTPDQDAAERKNSNLLFLSFMFSQGDSSLQQSLLTCIRNTEGKAEFDSQKVIDIFINRKLVSEPRFDDLGERYKPDWLIKHGRHNSAIDSEGPASFTDYLNILRSENNIPVGEDIAGYIGESVLRRDTYFLLEKDGRQSAKDRFKERENTKKENSKEMPLDDRYFSYFVYYVLRGNPTGVKVFDQVFSDYKSALKARFSKKENEFRGFEQKIWDNIKKLVEKYNETHPFSKIDLEDILK